MPGYLALGVAACAAVVCTPYGTSVIWYYRRFIGNSQLSHNIVEWARPSLTNPYSWAFLALIVAAAIAVVIAWRRGTRPDPLLCTLASLLVVFSLTAVRNQVWFGFGGSLLAADTLSRSGAGQVPVVSRAFARAVTAALGGLALISLGLLAPTPDSQFYSEIPLRAINESAAIAARNPALRILGDQWTGTPLLWLYPATLGRVAFDARLELYSPGELSAYFDFLNVRGPAWQRVTHGYGIIVASSVETPQLVSALARLPGWRVAYRAASTDWLPGLWNATPTDRLFTAPDPGESGADL